MRMRNEKPTSMIRQHHVRIGSANSRQTCVPDPEHRPHPITLVSRVSEAMDEAQYQRDWPAYYDLRTSLWDALAIRHMDAGHPIAVLSASGQLIYPYAPSANCAIGGQDYDPAAW